jgi:hypothetical protein
MKVSTRKITERAACAIFLACALSGCMATTGNARPLGATVYPPRPKDCAVTVFKDTPPSRPYVAIAQLDVHMEKTFFLPSDYDSAVGDLKRQACHAGADAIVNIKEEHSSYLETKMYNLSGTGIRFSDGTAQ